MLDRLESEIVRLGAELAALELEEAGLEALCAGGATDAALEHQPPAEQMEVLIAEIITAARAEMRSAVEDAERRAQDRVERATADADATVAAARAEVGEILVDRLAARTIGPRAIPDPGLDEPVDDPSPNGDGTAPPVIDETSVLRASSVPAGTGVPIEPPPGLRVDSWPTAGEDAEEAEEAERFLAFWREEDDGVPAARNVAVAPLAAVVPMIVALLVIVTTLLFVI